IRRRVTWCGGALILIAALAGSMSSVSAVGRARAASDEPACNQGKPPGFHLEPTIALTSTRANPDAVPPGPAAEIYLISPDGSNPRRLTDNNLGDGFPNLSPDGKKIVFDSARISGQNNVSDLFLMNA